MVKILQLRPGSSSWPFLAPLPEDIFDVTHSVMFEPHEDPCLILLVLPFNDLNIDYPAYLLFITFDYE